MIISLSLSLYIYIYIYILYIYIYIYKYLPEKEFINILKYLRGDSFRKQIK